MILDPNAKDQRSVFAELVQAGARTRDIHVLELRATQLVDQHDDAQMKAVAARLAKFNDEHAVAARSDLLFVPWRDSSESCAWYSADEHGIALAVFFFSDIWGVKLDRRTLTAKV